MSELSTHLASFHGYPIEIIDHNNKPWLTAEQIGLAIGIKHARTSVLRSYSRHADEFTDKMTCVVNVTTQGQSRQVRIFSPRGAWMLAMWAQTERAKQFRQWVLDVLEQHTQPQPEQKADKLPSTHSQVVLDQREYIDLLKAKITLLESGRRRRRDFTAEEKQQIITLHNQGKNNGEIGRLLGRGPSSIGGFLRKALRA